jgi:mono/diheme cytochrome c family protein
MLKSPSAGISLRISWKEKLLIFHTVGCFGRKVRSLALSASVAVMFLVAAPVRAADDIPEGAGKEIVIKVCTACHGIIEFTSQKHTKPEWDEVVDNMAQRGARASDDEFDMIVAYLAKNFGKDTPSKEAPKQ